MKTDSLKATNSRELFRLFLSLLGAASLCWVTGQDMREVLLVLSGMFVGGVFMWHRIRREIKKAEYNSRSHAQS